MKQGLGEIRIVEPEPQWTDRYERLYKDVYKQLSPTLGPIHDGLATFRQGNGK